MLSEFPTHRTALLPKFLDKEYLVTSDVIFEDPLYARAFEIAHRNEDVADAIYQEFRRTISAMQYIAVNPPKEPDQESMLYYAITEVANAKVDLYLMEVGIQPTT